MKARIKQYFTISKKEWNGLIVLVVLIAGVLAAPYVYHLYHKDNTINFKDFDKAVAQLQAAEKRGAYRPAEEEEADKKKQVSLFYFDPNTISAEQWQQLGLTRRQADVIEHYLQKGGHFYKKEDLKKIYSITDSDYQRLEPFISMSGPFTVKSKLKPGEVIELNQADSAKLMQLAGIGPSFAARIVRYRNRLGGFFSKEQLKEVYGIDSIKFDQIAGHVTVNPALVTKIDVNNISFNQLRLFPYLNFNQVNAIIQYRAQHGKYNSIAELKNIAILDQQTLQKIQPYLSFK